MVSLLLARHELTVTVTVGFRYQLGETSGYIIFITILNNIGQSLCIIFIFMMELWDWKMKRHTHSLAGSSRRTLFSFDF